jgi:hypothetical protein
LTRDGGGFPVSGPQGMGNREATCDPLSSKGLSVPDALGRKSAAGKPKSRSSAEYSDPGPTSDLVLQAAPLARVQRVYRSNATDVDALVEALYQFVMGTPDPKPESTCFRPAPE